MATNAHIVLAGGSGLMGRILARHFLDRGIPVTVLTRGKGEERDGITYVKWDPERPRDLEQHLNGARAVIGLNGATVDRRYDAKGKWTILHSRLSSTLALGDAITRCKTPPEAWLQLSTATIYRHAEERAMDQYTGEIGEGFSVEVARTWEAVANSFTLPATRRVLLRSAMVMSPLGGVLPRLVQLTKLGLGGRHASGEQYVSWIHAEDLCGAIDHILERPDVSGIYDLAAPEPARDGYLMEQLKSHCRAFIAIPQPTWLLRLGAFLLGTETELILKSRRVVPTRLIREGYRFKHPGITEALVDLLQDGRTGSGRNVTIARVPSVPAP